MTLWRNKKRGEQRIMSGSAVYCMLPIMPSLTEQAWLQAISWFNCVCVCGVWKIKLDRGRMLTRTRSVLSSLGERATISTTTTISTTAAKKNNNKKQQHLYFGQFHFSITQQSIHRSIVTSDNRCKFKKDVTYLGSSSRAKQFIVVILAWGRREAN